MIWLTWRQFRAQALAGLAVLAAAGLFLLATGLGMHHSYTVDLATCRSTGGCGAALGRLRQSYDSVLTLSQLFVVGAPALIGLFWGAPLVARELETGTHQLAWNQSVTRTRWLAVKLAGIGLASIAAAAALSYLLTWWAGPLDHITGSRFAALTFASRDVVPLAYAAFGFSLGTAAGALLRRTIPAMAATLAVFIAVQILVPAFVRPNLLPSTTITLPVNVTAASQVSGIYTSGGGADLYLDLPVPHGAWVLSAPPVEDSTGHVFAASDQRCLFPPATNGPPAKTDAPSPRQVATCLAGYDLHESVTYQPADHYWPLQWAETAIYLALAAALAASCAWWVRRRLN